ncbi:MAG: ABC transporter permease [Clostridia bacterium]|nr:ABC transporter permease [Clostridia bacterium]
MSAFLSMTKRNTALFFKDKGTFFSAMISPLILLLLFTTFLGNVYRDSLMSALPEGLQLDESVIEGFVIGWLFSSLLAVCCITTAFTANMIMVQDKVNGTRNDLTITPVKSSVLALSYYFSTAFVSLLICLVCAGVAFVYLGAVGWYLSMTDVVLLLCDIVLAVMFGTALSSVVCCFLKSQGAISAVTAIVSAGYGFLCGAYMPISSFSDGIRNFISLLPGTYATSLLRNHMVSGALEKMASDGVPEQVVEGIKDAFDINMYFFDESVNIPQMYIIVCSTVALLIGIYVVINLIAGKKEN